MTPGQKARVKRNQEMVRLAKKGMTAAAIGRLNGLTARQVVNICRTQGVTFSGGHPRKYPAAKVGDVFGDYTVMGLVSKLTSKPTSKPSSKLASNLTSKLACGTLRSREDEQVQIRCVCGYKASAYVFNLRRQPRCRPTFHNLRAVGR